jgi:hypothetical protein
MPCHEIRKAFDLARRLHHTYGYGRGGDLPQSARHGEDQVAASDLIAFGVQVNGSSGGLGGVKGKRAGKIREASYGGGNSRLLEFS